MKKKLSLSNKFFSSYFVKGVKDLAIDSYGIVTNLGKKPIKLRDKSSIKPYKSYLLKNYSLSGIDTILLTTFEFDPTRKNPDLNKFIKSNWNDNKVRYPNNPDKWHYKILMSPKDKIDGIEFNAWYLPANTASSIHREHPFPKEIHTQIYGLGIMSKFKDQDRKTLYQREYMPPGYTHDIFYDANFSYPWHQYEAVSDSIWLAIMEY